MISIPDWKQIFLPDTPILEILIRGSVIYLALFFLLRLVLKREASGLATSDLLMVVLLADAAQNGMTGGYESIIDGILLVIVIIGWSYILDWLGFHFPPIQRLIKPPKLLLVEKGRLLRKNMRKELITKEELMAELRKNNIGDVESVHKAYMESDGSISIIPMKKEK